MDNLSEILKNRTTPGILIFDMAVRLLYSNSEALEMVPGLQRPGKEGAKPAWEVPDEVRNICTQAQAGPCTTGDAISGLDYPVIKNDAGCFFSLRAFPIGDHGGEGEPTHIMVLVERITERHNVDLVKARERFDLSNREVAVLGLVCLGLTNKAISDKMFISEYTVKDHVKNIMKKMGVGNRSKIIAALQ